MRNRRTIGQEIRRTIEQLVRARTPGDTERLRARLDRQLRAVRGIPHTEFENRSMPRARTE